MTINKYDERYEIRLAKYSEIEKIMSFINEFWRKGHILALDRKLFEYEFVDGNQVNFVIAIDRNTGFIEGIFGFLNCSKTTDVNKKDIWGSMWKVVDSRENIPFLGVELAKRVFTLTGCRTQIGNGANLNTTVPLRRMFFGDKVAMMKQYYLLNNEIGEYKIAVIKDKNNKGHLFKVQDTTIVELLSINDVKREFDLESIDSIPYKDYWYINKRYFNHPYYKYKVYALQDSNGLVGALMMTRSVECNGSKVLRIVDYIGNQKLFAGLGRALEGMLKNNGYEYIDFYTLGFDEDYIFRAGFSLRIEQDSNIIPNYFEPFVRENAEIWAHYKHEGTLFFKADGDQDRPNEIRDRP